MTHYIQVPQDLYQLLTQVDVFEKVLGTPVKLGDTIVWQEKTDKGTLSGRFTYSTVIAPTQVRILSNHP